MGGNLQACCSPSCVTRGAAPCLLFRPRRLERCVVTLQFARAQGCDRRQHGARNVHRFCLHAAYSEALVRDLEGKELPGKLKPDRHVPTVELKASSEQLRSYFASRGAGAVHEQPLMAFERVSSAVLPPPHSQEDRDRDGPGFNEVTPCRP